MPPRPTKTIPMPKNKGNTVLAVRIGCHAGSLCCFNAVSVINKSISKYHKLIDIDEVKNASTFGFFRCFVVDFCARTSDLSFGGLSGFTVTLS